MPAFNLTDSYKGRLFFFALLYFVQGALFAYVFVFNNLFLRAFGATAGQLAIFIGISAIPFILKTVIGLVSDKFNLFGWGHRIPYIILGLILSIIGLLIASTLDPVAQFNIFIPAGFLIALGVATFDTVIDGFAIDITPKAEQKMVQSAMVIGRALGLIVLSSVYGRVIITYGWQAVFWSEAVFALLPLPLLLWVKEPKIRPTERHFSWLAIKDLWQPQIRLLLLFALTYSFVAYGAQAIVTLFANEGLGATLVQVGDASALGGVGILLGSVTLTLWGRKTPVWQQGIWVLGIASISLLGLAFITDLKNIYLMTLIWGACLGALELLFVTMAMQNADKRMSASTFAFF
ncbi:MAG: MFS transporter, partial [Methylococcales bacterium]|nr:MFS transporter [Methylococcales bacterium]